ncbi:MAG: ion transporter [Bacteroidaceae bacterium]|nr:ion transporter [Bacteroidaceae bacterium]
MVETNSDLLYSRIYDWFMMFMIFAGIFPLMFRTQNITFWLMDFASGICFTIDYVLRWITADLRSKRKPWVAFLIYPFTPMAIVDLISILPTFTVLSSTFKIARVSRLLKIIRVVKVIRYFEPLGIILAVIRRQSKILFTVLSLALFYVFVTALIMFNAELEINPETGEFVFNNFFEAFYWSACTLTTVGYGDFYPISSTGRIISIISSIVGIAIIALPSGIITAGYTDELNQRRDKKSKEKTIEITNNE